MESERIKNGLRSDNPFENNLESKEFGRRKASNDSDHKPSHPLKNKVIYTNKGWGVSAFNKKSPGTSANNLEKSHASSVNKSKLLKTGSSGFKENNSNVKRIGNQKIIYGDKNVLKSSKSKGGDVWVESNNDFGNSSGEWVEEARPNNNNNNNYYKQNRPGYKKTILKKK